jgi:radical SAM superfamily enzyme YgiQ (UPF0313 family)
MNVLLIYPQIPDTFWSFKHALKFIGKKAVSPPLGLLTVAAMLPETWNKRLIDLNVQRLTNTDLAWADYAFISAMIVQQKSTGQVIERCKTANVKSIAGGPLFTIEPDKFPEIDHLVLNEAELTLPPFLEDLAQGCPKHVYQTAEYADIHTTPVPMWELVDMRRYATMNIQFSRGCPFNCEFCNVTALLGHKPRIKTGEQIAGELNKLYDLGWRSGIFFVDDNFIGNKKYLKTKLLPAIIEWRADKPEIEFSTEASINLADDAELMQMMAQAGFTSVFVGIETPVEDSLAECNKKQNLRRDLVEDVKRIQRAGLGVQGGFIVGFDNDTPSVFQRQIDFIQKSGIVTAMVGLLQAPPGTKLYERMRHEGRLLESLSGDNVDGTTNIVPRMDIETLRKGYKNILEYIYSPKPYYARVKTFLRECRPPQVRTPLDLSRILAFFRSICRLGIIGKERVRYWQLFLWTLLRRPKLFPLAITLAVYGHHFRKTVEEHVL